MNKWQWLQFKFWLFIGFWWTYKLSVFNAYHTAIATYEAHLAGDYGDLRDEVWGDDPIYTVREFAESCVEEEVSCWDDDEGGSK